MRSIKQNGPKQRDVVAEVAEEEGQALTECLLTGHGDEHESSPGTPPGNNPVCSQLPTPAVKTQGLFKGSVTATSLST